MKNSKINANLIHFQLTFKWYDKIAAGLKNNEYRLVRKWAKKIQQKVYEFDNDKKPLILSLRRGYTKTFVYYKVKRISIINGLSTDLKVDELVYDFELGEQIYNLEEKYSFKS